MDAPRSPFICSLFVLSTPYAGDLNELYLLNEDCRGRGFEGASLSERLLPIPPRLLHVPFVLLDHQASLVWHAQLMLKSSVTIRRPATRTVNYWVEAVLIRSCAPSSTTMRSSYPPQTPSSKFAAAVTSLNAHSERHTAYLANLTSPARYQTANIFMDV